INYVHDEFRDKKSGADRRRRMVILGMWEQDGAVKLSTFSKLTQEIAAEYANKKSKTVARDLINVAKMGLIKGVRGGFRARKEIVLAFLPKIRKLESNE